MVFMDASKLAIIPHDMAHFPPRKNHSRDKSDKISKILRLNFSYYGQSLLLLLPINTVDHAMMYNSSWFQSVSYSGFFSRSIWNLVAQVPHSTIPMWLHGSLIGFFFMGQM